MIGKLLGTVDEIYEDSIIVSAGGVGYLVYVSNSTLGGTSVGQQVSLFIETMVKEDSLNLFGFTTRAEQKLFNMLITVQGVGPRLGLALLSLGLDIIVGAILGGGTKVLTSVSGVGPKVATRLQTELQDKLRKQGLNAASVGSLHVESAQEDNDLLLALKSLGYDMKESLAAAAYVKKAQPAGDSLNLPDMIKLSLRYLSGDVN